MQDWNEIRGEEFGRYAVAYTEGCSADCETNPNIDTSGCPVAGQGNSETAPEDSTPTCTYGRHSALVRQTCGKGLYAQYDGTLGANCYSTAGQAASPQDSGAQGANVQVAGAGGSTPNTSRAPVSGYPVAFEIAGIPSATVLCLGALRRRRSRG